MTRLYENSKVKKVLAWLLLVSTVLSLFISSNTETASADSNSRRMTSINLAAGVGLSDITDVNDIDTKSLQTIAVYLSNFYQPFITILDGEYLDDDTLTDDEGATEHFSKMKQALVRNCGFNKDVADLLVRYVLDQSLSSCKQVYMKKDELSNAFSLTTSSGKSFLGFMNFGNDARSGYYPGKNVAGNGEWHTSSIYYSNSGNDYLDKVETKTYNGEEYIPISYAIFLGVMMNVGVSEGVTVALGDYQFYTMSDNSAMLPVFSNSDYCLGMLMQALQFCDFGNGYSTGYSSLDGDTIKALNDQGVTQKALIVVPDVYVNWEGSLVLDNGVYRTVILPGCMNPYMIETFDKSSKTWEQYPNYINSTSLSSIASDYTRTHGSSADSGLEFFLKLSMSSTYQKDYRVVIGGSAWNFDAAWGSGWGDNQPIANATNATGYATIEGKTGDDHARLPTLSARTWEDNNHGMWDSYVSGFSASNFGTDVTGSEDIVWYDSFSPIKSDTGLADLFKTQNVFADTFISNLSLLDDTAYAQFKTITKQGHSLEYPRSTQKLFQNIYLTYCFAAFNETYSDYDVDVNIVPIRMHFENFPSANVDIDWPEIESNALANEVMSFVYYLLHPVEGIGYVVTLIKNKLGGVLIGWHEDMVGATSSNSATGMTKYLGTSSYTTMPRLSDVSWISGIVNIYNNIIVYLLILMTLILLCYVLTGSMTIQRGVVGLVLFGVCAFLPPFAINMSVDTINTVSDTVFSKKFDFWAICQLQTFVEQYQYAMEAQASGDFTSYASFVISNTQSDIGRADDESAISYSGTKLKWMAPKKYNSLSNIVTAVNEGTAMGQSDANFLKSSLLNMVARSTSGETYLSDTEALYLYRDYSDIFKYAHTSYNIWGTFNYGGDLKSPSGTNKKVSGYPLGVFIDDLTGSSSYSLAWETNASRETDAFTFVAGAVSIDITKSTYKEETSSVVAISKGYLYNTIRYDWTDSSVTEYHYLYSHDDMLDNRVTKNTLAVSYLANYNKTFKEVHSGITRLDETLRGAHTIPLKNISSNDYYNFGLTKATADSYSYRKEVGSSTIANPYYGSYLWGYQEIIGLKDESITKAVNSDSSVSPTVDSTYIVRKTYKNLSDVFYGLYSESPFYYFNANIRDQINATSLDGDNYRYNFDNLIAGRTSGSNGSMNHIAKMFLANNQEYFFNLTPNAGDGYGELRDFMNMHDFFYFVIPYMREGVELARMYDDVFGLYIDDDCSLIVNADGSIVYDGRPYKNLGELGKYMQDNSGTYTDEALYKLWHTYNTYTILSAYTPWLDAMMDCDYAKSEHILVMGDKFTVSDPLNPYSYFKTDEQGYLTSGRYMIFSRSEMTAMGLTTSDLTTVERKIIELQDNVYTETLKLMNYYTFSDEVMIQAYAMLQTFEFNKIFSQSSMFGESYILYPQGYELKAFSYDAYLRMVVSGSSGESLMFSGDSGNVSIYERVMKNTSLFFGIFLLLNDILAVYIIPGLKLFFLIVIFFCSILILVASVVKMEMNILSVLWKSLFAPLLSFCAISIGMSIIVSMFMHTGANGVVSSEFVINMGDPTSAIIVMMILNAGVVILMFKICKKCFKDLITYGKAVFDNIGSTMVGAVGAMAAGVGSRAMDRFSSGEGGSKVSNTPKQRGRDNDPKSGKRGIGFGGALAAGAVGAAGASAAIHASQETMSKNEKKQMEARKKRDDDMVGMNKYDKKAYQGQNTRQDKAQAKADRMKNMSQGADAGRRRGRLEAARARAQKKANTAAIKADNIKRYGSGVRGRVENVKTSLGVNRANRLKQLGLSSNSENVKKARNNGRTTDGKKSIAKYKSRQAIKVAKKKQEGMNRDKQAG